MENSSQSSTNPISQGCGTNNNNNNSQITIHVNPTTGGDFYINVEPDTSIENLKKIVSKRLKVPRDRICLLFRDKQLQEGNLIEYGISDGARITLLPNVETGLITQRPEIGIMQALESLNDTQVNEFLCGKAPLNLSMRLGDHMMLIQLQLSTVSGATKPPPNNNNNNSNHNNSGTSSNNNNNLQTTTNPPSLLQASRNLQHTLRRLSADVFSGRNRGRRESVYSGTFSGALNPALQDPKGRPRRDVATIVHILNDLLCSVPELRRVTTATATATSTSSQRRTNTNINNTTTGTNVEESLGVVPECEQEENDLEPTTAPSTSTNTTTSTTHHRHYCSEDQNLKTRGKLEHLRLVMGERRERRRQRKQKPYSLPPSDNTDTVTA